MSNKQWYIFFVSSKYGMNRYLVEHYIAPEFESLAAYNRWQNMMRKFFAERTGIKSGRIVAIEPSEVISAYPFRKEDGYQG